MGKNGTTFMLLPYGILKVKNALVKSVSLSVTECTVFITLTQVGFYAIVTWL
jgi:hypothetical protein